MICIPYRQNIKINTPCAAKILQCWKYPTYACLAHQDFEIEDVKLSFNTNNYIRVSFSVVVIITLKELKGFNKKKIMKLTTSLWFRWVFGCWEDERKPVWAMGNDQWMSINPIGFMLIHQKLPQRETEIIQPLKQVHRSPRSHMIYKWHAYLFVKRSIFI